MRLYCKYLRTGTRYRRKWRCKLHYSHTWLPKLVNFGPQTVKIGQYMFVLSEEFCPIPVSF